MRRSLVMSFLWVFAIWLSFLASTRCATANEGAKYKSAGFVRSVGAITVDSLRLSRILEYCLVRRLAPEYIPELNTLHVIDDSALVTQTIAAALLPFDPDKTTPENEYLTVTLPERLLFLERLDAIHPRENAAELWLDDLGRDVIRLGIPFYTVKGPVGLVADYANGSTYEYACSIDHWQRVPSEEQIEKGRKALSGSFSGRRGGARLQGAIRAELVMQAARDSRIVDTGFEYDSLRYEDVYWDVVPLPWPRGQSRCDDGISFVFSLNIRAQTTPFFNPEDSTYSCVYKYVIYDLAHPQTLLAADSQLVPMPTGSENFLGQVLTSRIHCMIDTVYPTATNSRNYVCGIMIINKRKQVWQASTIVSLESQRPITPGLKGMVLEGGQPNVTNTITRGDSACVLIPIIGLPWYEPKESHHGYAYCYFIRARELTEGRVHLTDFGLYDEKTQLPIDPDYRPRVPDIIREISTESKHGYHELRFTVPTGLKPGTYHLFVVIQSSAPYIHPLVKDAVPVVRGHLEVLIM